MKNFLTYIASVAKSCILPAIAFSTILLTGIYVDLLTSNISQSTKIGYIAVTGVNNSIRNEGVLCLDIAEGDNFFLGQNAASSNATIVASYLFSVHNRENRKAWLPNGPVRVDILLSSPLPMNGDGKLQLMHKDYDGHVEKISDWGYEVINDSIISFWFITKSFSMFAVILD